MDNPTQSTEPSIAEQVAAGIAAYTEAERARLEEASRLTRFDVHEIARSHARREANAALWRGLLYLEVYFVVMLFLSWWLRDRHVDGERASDGD